MSDKDKLHDLVNKLTISLGQVERIADKVESLKPEEIKALAEKAIESMEQGFEIIEELQSKDNAA